MSEQQTGGPAFPGFDYIDQHGKKNPEGMTLRDYFAAKAMQALIQVQVQTKQQMTPAAAYEWADAMLKARSQD